jgi:hypothetical protein
MLLSTSNSLRTSQRLTALSLSVGCIGVFGGSIYFVADSLQDIADGRTFSAGLKLTSVVIVLGLALMALIFVPGLILVSKLRRQFPGVPIFLVRLEPQTAKLLAHPYAGRRPGRVAATSAVSVDEGGVHFWQGAVNPRNRRTVDPERVQSISVIEARDALTRHPWLEIKSTSGETFQMWVSSEGRAGFETLSYAGHDQVAATLSKRIESA